MPEILLRIQALPVPPLEMIAGDTSTWKATWISLPYSGPMVFGFLPLVHTGRGLQGLHLGQVRIKNGSPRDRLRNLTLPRKHPEAAAGRAMSQTAPEIKANFQLFRR